MKLIPQNDNVLCVSLSSNEKTTSTGFIYKSNDVVLYKVVDVGPNVKMDIKSDDVIVVNSTGTKTIVDDVEYYLFREENIAGKVLQ